MSSILLTTTGTQDPVELTDLGRRQFAHPTTDFDLLTENFEDRLVNSASLQAAMDAGHVTITRGGVTIANMKDVSIEGIFGGFFRRGNSFGESVDSTGTFVQKIRVNTPSNLPAGTYRIAWCFACTSSASNNEFEARCVLDVSGSIDVIGLHTIGGGNLQSERHWQSGYKYQVLTAGSHTIDLEFRRSAAPGTVTIRDATIEIWKIAD